MTTPRDMSVDGGPTGPDMVERVARALMRVNAPLPGNALNGLEVPVLSLDPDFDDLPLDHTQGVEGDEITQEAVLRLARVAIEAMREPTKLMLAAGEGVDDWSPEYGDSNANAATHWRAMIDAALQEDAQ